MDGSTRGVLLVLSSLAALGAAIPKGKSAPEANASELPSATEVDPIELAGAPVSLTASDGTGLRLESYKSKTVIQGPLAITELELSFDNPVDRTLEGTFKLLLPPNAAISRFAMKIGNEFREGEVVEKARARAVYEDFLHRRQDPALIEKGSGGEFFARVFPIPARSSKHIIVSYTDLVASSGLVLPVHGLPRIDNFEVRIYEQGTAEPIYFFVKEDFTPDQNIVVNPTRKNVAVKNGDFFVAPVKPVFTSGQAQEKLAASVVLLDTSASQLRTFEEELTLLQNVLQKSGDAIVSVVAFDVDAELVYEGKASAFDGAQVERLRQRGALGATDLERALHFAKDVAIQRKDSPDRVILISDGTANVGEKNPAKLAVVAQELYPAGNAQKPEKAEKVAGKPAASGAAQIRRLDAITVNVARDNAVLNALSRCKLPSAGLVLDSYTPWSEKARRLTLPVYRDVPVSIPGAAWYGPQKLSGLQQGDTALVYARLPGARGMQIKIGNNAAISPEVEAMPGPLVERAVIAAKIEALENSAEADTDDTKRRIVKLSREYRVLSKHTGMLVLETNEDFTRFEIDRSQKQAFASIEDGKIVVRTMGREGSVNDAAANWGRVAERVEEPLGVIGHGAGTGSANATLQAARREAAEFGMIGLSTTSRSNQWGDSIGNSFGAGGLGLSGTGEGGGGFGNGGGKLTGSHASRAPQLRQGPITVEGVTYSAGASPNWGAPPSLPVNAVNADNAGFVSKAWSGKYLEVQTALTDSQGATSALRIAADWLRSAPGDILAVVAYGDAALAAGDTKLALRAYSSVLELYGFRADQRRFAANLAERVGTPLAKEFALGAYRDAEQDRPDHPSSKHLLAFALSEQGKHKEAFELLEHALEAKGFRYTQARYALQQDLVLLGHNWAHHEAAQRRNIENRLKQVGLKLESEDKPSVRYVVTWETDATDVDLVANYGKEKYPSKYVIDPMGEGTKRPMVLADIREGYGPEVMVVRSPLMDQEPTLSVRYQNKGPMGYGAGKLQAIFHDGKGTLTTRSQPFVVMNNMATVDVRLPKVL
jgi:Vault protein inter-alpha-trypsin domain/von Willebrand factor type A domain